MWEQEKKHLYSFNKILGENRVRPSALMPIWERLGYVLGVGTALLGKEAAMACTEAVETVIGQHYNEYAFLLLLRSNSPDSQLRELIEMDPESKEKDIQEFKTIIKEFRDDELEHLDVAVEHDSKQAIAYPLLTQVIQAGCKIGIKVAEKI